MNSHKQPAKRAANKESIADRGETISLMQPLLVGEASRQRTALTDLAVELAGRAAGLRRSLPEGVLTALADLVRAMNCYYSNLIEGHDTHPVDIERAMKNDYSADPEKRNLQREAKAHITVQKWIDAGGLKGRATTADGREEIHRRFCEELPEELLWVEYPDAGERVRVIPGELRERDVEVGRLAPILPEPFPASWSGSRVSTPGSARRTAFLPLPARITVWRGFTRSLMATGALRA